MCIDINIFKNLINSCCAINNIFSIIEHVEKKNPLTLTPMSGEFLRNSIPEEIEATILKYFFHQTFYSFYEKRGN